MQVSETLMLGEVWTHRIGRDQEGSSASCQYEKQHVLHPIWGHSRKNKLLLTTLKFLHSFPHSQIHPFTTTQSVICPSNHPHIHSTVHLPMYLSSEHTHLLRSYNVPRCWERHWEFICHLVLMVLICGVQGRITYCLHLPLPKKSFTTMKILSRKQAIS